MASMSDSGPMASGSSLVASQLVKRLLRSRLHGSNDILRGRDPKGSATDGKPSSGVDSVMADGERPHHWYAATGTPRSDDGWRLLLLRASTGYRGADKPALLR